jgi:hypothetical protein
MNQQEEWRPIPGFDGYEASSLGRIFSRRRGSNRVLKGWLDKKGYRKVFVYSPDGRAERFVHALIAEAFHGPRPEGADTRHLDGDKSNNAASNIRWGSRSENELDKVRHGAHHNARKTHCPARHPYSPDNTYITPVNGDRNCRTCARDRRQAAALRAASVPTERAA